MSLSGGEAGVQIMVANRGRKGPLYGITPEYERDMGAGQLWKGGGNRTTYRCNTLEQENN